MPASTVIDSYVPRYRLPAGMCDLEHTREDALARGRAAAHRIVREHPTGITVGAEEDAEAAVYVIARSPEPGPALLALGELLVKALTDLQEDGQLADPTYRNLNGWA